MNNNILELNIEYLNRIKFDLGEVLFNDYIHSFMLPCAHGLTLNLKKLSYSNIDLNYVINRFKGNILYNNNNYVYLSYDKKALEELNVFPGKDPLYHIGLYYIQEPSAAKVLMNVDFKESDIVLDMCASPGGKSCQILYNLDIEKGGFLVSNECIYERCKILSSNIERMGFDNAVVINNSAEDILNNFSETFDKVIIDAPCSGEGMFRKSEIARKQWTSKLVKSCANIQKELLNVGYNVLKKGGLLIYSTCTFSKDEDEDNIDYIINKYNGLSILKTEKLYPNSFEGEGQFYAILKKNDGGILNHLSFDNIDKYINIHILRKGIKINDIKDGQYIKSHASTHYEKIGNSFYNIDLDDEEINRYLKGETLRKNIDYKGYCRITYKGMGIGLGKVVNGMIKNHYPKGLRNM